VLLTRLWRTAAGLQPQWGLRTRQRVNQESAVGPTDDLQAARWQGEAGPGAVGRGLQALKKPGRGSCSRDWGWQCHCTERGSEWGCHCRRRGLGGPDEGGIPAAAGGPASSEGTGCCRGRGPAAAALPGSECGSVALSHVEIGDALSRLVAALTAPGVPSQDAPRPIPAPITGPAPAPAPALAPAPAPAPVPVTVAVPVPVSAPRPMLATVPVPGSAPLPVLPDVVSTFERACSSVPLRP